MTRVYGRMLLAGLAIMAVLCVTAGIRDAAVLSAARHDPDAKRWHRLHVLRVEGQGCQRRLGLRPTPWRFEQPRGGMLRYALGKWAVIRRDACAEVRHLRDPVRAIYAVFGDYGAQAVRVAHCETGGTFSVWARNGQYMGIFQMGSHERATYGHGSTPLAQARAAYRYFVASGRDWSPWACKPW